MAKLDGKVALITGAAAGLGEGISTAYAKYGAKLIMVDLSPEVEKTAEKLRKEYNAEIITVVANVADRAQMDAAAAKGSFKGVEAWHIIAVCLQGIRIAIPAAALLAIPSSAVAAALNSMPAWLTDGMSIGGGMVVAVGYAMVINMMATKEVWPFFAIGFCLAAVSDLTLIALGVIAVSMALIYLKLSENAGSGNGGSNTGDPLGDILNDY